MTTSKQLRRKQGFTLVELVIVVLVLGIIAAAAAPKLFDTANDARDSASRHSLVVLRNALELHRADIGNYPSVATITTALLPYLQGPFPEVQVGGNAGDATVASSGVTPVVAGGGSEGWIYNATTGEIRINDAAYETW